MVPCPVEGTAYVAQVDMVLQWARAKEEIELGKTMKGLAGKIGLACNSDGPSHQVVPVLRTRRRRGC